MKYYLLVLMVFYNLFIFSQENKIEDNYIAIKGDSIMENLIELNEIILLPTIKFTNRDKFRDYLILKRKTLKVYPYAKLASVRLESLYEKVNDEKKRRNRQTGFTVYEVIKDLKSGLNAFLFNTTAKVFNMSLKVTYSPLKVKEDYFIEDILQKSFQSGLLEYTSPKNEIPDLFYLKKLWSTK